jgi:THO complex subunit 2
MSVSNHLTPELLADWANSSSSLLSPKFTQFQNEAIQDHNSANFLELLREFVYTAARSSEKSLSSNLADFLANNLDKTPSENHDSSTAQQYLLDTLWTIWFELGASTSDTAEPLKKRFISFINDSLSRSLVTGKMLKFTLQEDLLELLDIWPAKVLQAALIKVRTKELYTQTKFNLLREESQGYSKFYVELNNFWNHNPNYSTYSVQDFLQTKLNSLIGYYNLDPNRVIDIILDTYERNLARNIKINPNKANFLGLMAQFNAQSVTQLLGFKFEQYNEQRPAPYALFATAALLIGANFVALGEIWAYLGPSDSSIRQQREEYLQNEIAKSKKLGVVSLSKEEGNEKAKESKDSKENNEITVVQQGVVLAQSAPCGFPIEINPTNQKFQLLRAFLDQNQWENAEKLLKFYSAACPAGELSVAKSLCDFVHRLIGPFYEPIAAAYGYQILQNKARPAAENLPSASTIMAENEGISRLVALAQFKDSVNVSDQSYRELIGLLEPVMSYLGQYLHVDASLVSKLCRILRHIVQLEKNQFLAEKGAELEAVNEFSLSEELEDFVCRRILVAFSLIPSNVGLSVDLWAVLSLLPYPQRYRIYGDWLQEIYDSSVELSILRSHINNQTKYFRKRISAAAARSCGRLLSKFSLSNPLLVFDLILQQVQAFDNMINPVVETLKYQTQLNLDCCVYVQMLQWANPNKAKLKSDGMNEAHWFQSLSTFAANFYRRFPDVELEPTVQYIINQLKLNESLDLLLVKELLSEMASVEVYEDVSSAQIEGQAGGPLLNAETVTVRSTNKNKKKTTQALLEVLVGKKLIVPFLILLVQQRAGIIHATSYEHERLIGELYDKAQEIMLALVELLFINLSNENYAKLWPNLHELCTKYFIPPNTAFHVLRRILHYKKIQGFNEEDGADGQAPVKMEDSAEKTANNSMTSSISPPLLISTCRQLLPEAVWLSISPEFYCCFWRLSQYDLYVPTAQYAASIKKLQNSIKNLEKQAVEGKLNEKQKKEKERLNKLIQSLRSEEQQQKAKHGATLAEIESHIKTWLVDIPQRSETVSSFIQHCILPRVFVSALDAFYAANFVQILVKLGCPYFSLVIFYDLLIKSVAPLIASCSSNEASRFGRFLAAILQQINNFCTNEAIYEKEGMISPVFSTQIAEPAGEKLSFSRLALCNSKWQQKLLRTFTKKLAASSKMEISNALLVLSKITGEWPKLQSSGEQLERQLELIMEDEENKNTALKVLSTRSHALLQAQRKNWIKDIKETPKAAAGSANAVTNAAITAPTIATKTVPAKASSSKPSSNPSAPAPVKSTDRPERSSAPSSSGGPSNVNKRPRERPEREENFRQQPPALAREESRGGEGTKSREGRDSRDSRENRDNRESRESRDSRDNRENRENRDKQRRVASSASPNTSRLNVSAKEFISTPTHDRNDRAASSPPRRERETSGSSRGDRYVASGETINIPLPSSFRATSQPAKRKRNEETTSNLREEKESNNSSSNHRSGREADSNAKRVRGDDRSNGTNSSSNNRAGRLDSPPRSNNPPPAAPAQQWRPVANNRSTSGSNTNPSSSTHPRNSSTHPPRRR